MMREGLAVLAAALVLTLLAAAVLWLCWTLAARRD